MQQKILILGISSFAGASFADYLLNNSNLNIIGTFNKKNKLPFKYFLERNKNFKKIKLIKLNLSLKKNNLCNLVSKIKPDYIIDFASVCMVNESWKYPNHYFNVNFNSKIDFINNLNKQKNLKKYIYIGTPEIFGSSSKPISEKNMNFNPSTPYASSKLALEIFLNNFINDSKYKIIIARFSNFYGLGQPMYRLIPKLIYCINKGIKFPLQGTGNSKRDFIFDQDFNNGLFKIIKKGKVGNKYHFSGEKYHKIKDIIKEVIKIKNYSWKKLIKITNERKGKDKNYFLDCKKTKQELRWQCNIDLKNGLKKTVKYYDEIIKHMNINETKFKIKLN